MRYALGVEYDGSDFRGWQNLGEGGPSVQASLEQALSSVADSPLQVVCAGRTDAGVHGQCQVVHFDTDVVRDPRAWMLGTTTRLPRSIAVRWCVPVADDFHARFGTRAPLPLPPAQPRGAAGAGPADPQLGAPGAGRDADARRRPGPDRRK